MTIVPGISLQQQQASLISNISCDGACGGHLQPFSQQWTPLWVSMWQTVPAGWLLLAPGTAPYICTGVRGEKTGTEGRVFLEWTKVHLWKIISGFNISQRCLLNKGGLSKQQITAPLKPSIYSKSDLMAPPPFGSASNISVMNILIALFQMINLTMCK